MKRLKKTSSKTNLQFKPRQTLFWDVNPKTVDPRKHAQYVIERIMDFGNDQEVRWMWQYYPTKQLKQVVTASRSLLPRSRNFWKLVIK